MLKVNDFAFAIVTEATRAVNIARGMVEDAERAARAEVRAKEYTLCRFCQAALTNFLIANPDADHETTQAETQTLWEDCRSCSEEYNTHLDAQAEEWENRSYGESYAEELNANPHRFHEAESGYRKEKSEKEDWRAWREDYRSSRPPVTCQKCDTHYPRGKDEGNAIYDGYTLVECGNCQDVVFYEDTRRQAEIKKVSDRILRRKPKEHLANRPGPAREPEILFPHVYKRIFRDVACRYIRRFGGDTFSVQTAADDCEIYLRNRHGLTIATVSLLNRFPEKVDTAIFDDLPY